MKRPSDLRASERIPSKSRVQVMAKGRTAFMVLAINISMGGILLNAAPNLPVGSVCRLSIFPEGSPKQVVTEGTVVRSDSGGTAIQFAQSLEKPVYETFAAPAGAAMGQSILDSYRNYFRVSRSADLQGCEEQLGVTKRQFRTVFYSTFTTCIPLAILPVWLLRASIPVSPNWVKIAASFAYGAVWLAAIQPTMDILAFRIIRGRNGGDSKALT